MSQYKSMGVRLEERQLKQLKAIASNNGVEVGQLIRAAVDVLIKHVERHDGRLHLPIDFNEIWKLETPDEERKRLKSLSKEAEKEQRSDAEKESGARG